MKTFLQIARLILPCLALALAPAAVASSPASLHQAASLADLEATVASLGHEIEARDPANHSLRAADAQGTRYVLTGTACDIEGVPGCRGIAMQVLFSSDETVSYEKLAEANLNQVAVSTRYDPETRVISVTRYMVLDGGVTMDNVAENVRVLLALAPEVLGIVFAQAEGAAPSD